MNITQLITKMIARENLSYEEMREAMRALMSGETTDIQNAGFLTALATKGETAEEILAAAEIMRELSTKVAVRDSSCLVDPVGTGGTYSRVFNVSTASSLVAACAGVTIAKHGSRSASSKSGSADFLEIAGVNIDLNAEQMSDCIEKFGIGFMYAPNLHSAMKHVMPARKGTGVRTIFNLLGPLTNPTQAKRQVLGVFNKQWLLPMAQVSKQLGQQRVMVIHSQDGLDEISIAAPTDVVELESGFIKSYTLDPREFGICHDSLEAVRVDSAEESLQLIKSAFSGEKTPAYDMIALNSAAIIMVSGVVESFADGLEAAYEILDNGKALEKLSAYAEYTQQFNKDNKGNS